MLNLWGGYAPAYRNLGILYDLYFGDIEKALGYYQDYQAFFAEPNRQVKGWIVDIERRLKAQQAQKDREAAALAAQQQAEQSAVSSKLSDDQSIAELAAEENAVDDVGAEKQTLTPAEGQ